MRIVFVFLIALSVFCVPAAFAAGRQTIAGTPVSLIPLQGFEPAGDFSGFINHKTGAGILAAIFPPESGKEMMAIFNDHKKFTQAMSKLQFNITNHADAITETGNAITIYSGTQSDGDRTYGKWATLIAANSLSGNGIYMITLQSPLEAKLKEEDALALFRSIRLGAWNSLEVQIEALPFSFRATAPFTAKAALMGSAITLEASPDPAAKTAPVTIYIIRDPQTHASGDVRQVQNLYLASIRQAFSLKTITGEKTVRFAGAEGRQLTGSGLNADGKTEDIVLYTALDANNKAIHLQATGAAGSLAPLRQQIEQIARSIALKAKHRP